MLGADLRAVDGPAVGAWIRPALGGSDAVEDQVPKLFESYARVFHPASDGEGNKVPWAEVARRLGSTAHPGMQWHQIVGTKDTFGRQGSNWPGGIPKLGAMPVDTLDRLCAVLGEQTADPAHCYFGLCLINHGPLADKTVAEQGPRSRLELPTGRDHLVLSGPLEAVSQIGDTDPPGLMVFVRKTGPGEEPAERPEPDPTDPFWRESPSLIWPADRSWFVASEVDFDSTVIGGNRALVDALLAAPGLEVFEVEPETKLTAFSDELNPLD